MWAIETAGLCHEEDGVPRHSFEKATVLDTERDRSSLWRAEGVL